MSSTKSRKEIITDKLYYPIRIAILLSVVFLFIPNLNPARISGMINKNMSLFSAGISYSSLTAEFGRAFRKGWVEESSMQLLFVSSMAMCLGIVAFCVSGCMSLGNLKFKKTGNIIGTIGCAAELAGIGGIYIAYLQISQTAKPDKIQPVFPSGLLLILIITLLILLISVIQLVLFPKLSKKSRFEMPTKYRLFLMLMPFLALVAVFAYLPLWGWRYAFFDYKVGDSISMENFVGFKWFTELFKNPATVRDIVRVLKNTLAMSGLGIATSWLPMAFAIFLSEIKNIRFRRFVQTLTTVPNFISWVLVYAIAFCIFSTDGFVSSIMVECHYLYSGDFRNRSAAV